METTYHNPYPIMVLGMMALVVLGKALFYAYKKWGIVAALLTLVLSPFSLLFWAVVAAKDLGAMNHHTWGVMYFYGLLSIYILAKTGVIEVPLPL